MQPQRCRREPCLEHRVAAGHDSLVQSPFTVQHPCSALADDEMDRHEVGCCAMYSFVLICGLLGSGSVGRRMDKAQEEVRPVSKNGGCAPLSLTQSSARAARLVATGRVLARGSLHAFAVPGLGREHCPEPRTTWLTSGSFGLRAKPLVALLCGTYLDAPAAVCPERSTWCSNVRGAADPCCCRLVA